MENKEQTKDYLIFKQDGCIIEIRFRTLTEELYNDFFKDCYYNGLCDNFIFEYEKVIKNFTWENYEHYLKYESKDFNLIDFDKNDLYNLIELFEPENIVSHCYDYFGEINAERELESVKKAIETIIKELKNIKNTRTYVYSYSGD